MKFIKEHILFLLILLSCIILRFIPLFEYQFTLDEWSGLDRTRFDSFGELIEKGVKIDAHPAFVQVLLWIFVKLFGFTNWIIKLPFLLFSFGCVIYSYVFCLRNFSKQVGLIASAIFSYSLIFVFYAPIARMYISGAFFSIALLYHFYEIFFNKNEKLVHYVLFGSFALLSALNQHINSLFAFTVCASGVLFLNKNNFKAYLITCLAAVLLYLPHLSVTLYQLSIGGIGFEQGGWLPIPDVTSVFSFLQVLFGTGKSYIIICCLVLFTIIANRQFKLTKAQIYLLLLFFANYLVIYLYSVYRAPVFQYSVMLFSSVAIVLFVASLLDFKNKYFFYGTLLVLISVLFFKTYIKKDYIHQSVQNIFEFQFDYTNEIKKQLDCYPIFFDADTLMREVCFTRGNYNYDCKLTKDSATFSLKKYSKLVSGLKTDCIVLASSSSQHQAIAQQYFPYLIRNIETQGVNYRVYSKSNKNALKDEDVLQHSTLLRPGVFSYDRPPVLVIHENNFTLPVDTFNEFILAGRTDLFKISNTEGQVILAKLKIKQQVKNLEGVQLCISISDINTDSSYYFTGVNNSDFVMDKDSCTTLYSLAYLGTDYNRIKDKSKITIFLWNTKKEKFIVNAFEIKTINYWRKKWGLWD